LWGCGQGDVNSSPDVQEAQSELTAQQRHGRDVWLNSTFGGEKFFSLILPGPPFNLTLGLVQALTSPRDTRFDNWGLLNDPDCVAGNAMTFGFDICADPSSSGVVGVRKFANPDFQPGNGQPPILLGVACASCHAGLNPENPPTDPNHPGWDNIHLTVGNQFIQIGKIFGANLSPHDPRFQVFRTWAPGTVDTTAIENDHINNPGIITQFFRFPDRPFFNLTQNGAPITVHRAGQGGEDDAGCVKAATRVYFNIGMCAAECMVGHLANGPGGSQTPIDEAQCARDCADFRQEQVDAVDLCAFIQTTRPPHLRRAPGGDDLIDESVVDRGRRVFDAACAACHSNGEDPVHQVYSDDLIHPATGFNPFIGEPANSVGTNACRARTTNWMAGHIWAAFSSDQYKGRPTGGPGFYRDVPLLAIWATAPFMHNNRMGTYTGDFTVAGRVAAFEDAFDQLMNPWRRDFLGSIQRITDFTVIPTPFGNVTLPPGVPVVAFSNLDPQNPFNNLCPEFVENGGHYFGVALPEADKYWLREYLKTL